MPAAIYVSSDLSVGIGCVFLLDRIFCIKNYWHFNILMAYIIYNFCLTFYLN